MDSSQYKGMHQTYNFDVWNFFLSEVLFLEWFINGLIINWSSSAKTISSAFTLKLFDVNEHKIEVCLNVCNYCD